jgi:polyisoprenoid-binding protein YceI
VGSVGSLGLLIQRRRLRQACLLAAALPVAAFAAPPGHIRFKASNLLTTAEGEFHDWRIVQAVVDDAEPARSRVSVEVLLKSLATGIGQRDDHLRSADFFDVEKFPKAQITLEGFHPDGADAFVADVTLDLHGRSKRFPMRFRIADRAARRIAGEVILDRRDFEIGEPFSRWTPLSIKNEVAVEVEAIVPPPQGPGAAP